METSINSAALRGTRVDSALRVAAVVLTVSLIVVLTFVPRSENDFWLQAKIGQMIVETGEIPRTVLFPFTWVRDNAFNAHEWLPSIVFHLLDRSVGQEGLLWVLGALGLGLFGLCFVLAHRLSGSLAVGLLLPGMAMVVANYRHHLRPEIFALVLFVVLLHVLSAYRARGDWRVLAWTAPIALIWANTHGSFMLGPVVATIFAAGEAVESGRRSSGLAPSARLHLAARVALPYVAVFFTMIATSLVNPLGIELLHFAVSLSASEVTKTFIQEWNPTLSPSFMGRPAFAIFVAAAAVTLAVVVALRRRLTATDGLLLAAFALLALQRSRFVVLFGFVAMFVCARLAGARPWRRHWERPLLATAIGAAAVGVTLALQFGNAHGAFPFHTPSNDLTPPMLDQLSRPEMQGNVLNSYELGAELIYRAYPRLRPSIDSRIDSYGDRYFLLQEQLLVDESLLKQFIADYDVRYMLLLRRDFARVRKLEGLLQQGWRVQFADHKAVLLSRLVLGTTGGSLP